MFGILKTRCSPWVGNNVVYGVNFLIRIWEEKQSYVEVLGSCLNVRANLAFPPPQKFCDLVLAPGLIYLTGHTGSAVEKHLEKLNGGQLPIIYRLQRRFLQGVLTSAIMHLGCYQYFKAIFLRACYSGRSNEGSMDTPFFFLAIHSHIIVLFNKTGGYTWRWVGCNVSEQTFPDGKWEFHCLEWFDFKANNTFLFQSTWKW